MNNLKKLTIVVFIMFSSIIFLTTFIADGGNPVLSTDNTKTYDLGSKTITIKDKNENPVSTIRLVSEHPRVIFDEDYAFEIEVNLTKSYNGAISKIDFYKMKDFKSKEIVSKVDIPDYELKYYDPNGAYYSTVYIYDDVCETDLNGTYHCYETTNGSYNVTRYGTWETLDSSGDLSAGITRIRGYYHGLQEGEVIEFIPEMFGLELSEWASFSDAKLYEYYSHFPATGGLNVYVDTWGGQNFTIGTVGTNENFQIIGVTLYLFKQGSPDYTVYVNIHNASAGVDPGVQIASGNFEANTVGSTDKDNPTQINVSIPGNVTLSAGAMYYLVLNCSGGDGSNRLKWDYLTSVSYSGGNEIYSTDQGGSWTNNVVDRDLYFQIWGTNVSGGGDTTPPYFTSIPSASSLTFGTSLGVDFNATDETGFDSYAINWTTTFTINSSGYLSNSSSLAVGNYYINVTINDTSNNLNSTIYNFNVTADVTGPTITFISQDPSDLNVFSLGKINFSYDITDISHITANTVRLYYKTNDSVNDYYIIVNGTPLFTGYTFNNVTITNVSSKFNFTTDEYRIFPAKYNYDPELMEDYTHSYDSLANVNQYFKIEILNISGSKNYNFIEFMANTSSLTYNLESWYCNSSYTTGDPEADPNCIIFNSLAPTSTFNHTHSSESKHQVLSFPINATSGTVGETVVVTSTSYFLLHSNNNAANEWDFYYIVNESRSGDLQKSVNKGLVWTEVTGTPDFHVHQYNSTEIFYYYVCANDTLSNSNCSSVRSDSLNILNLPPSSVSFYSPKTGVTGGNININYSAASPSGGSYISFYNISLVYENTTYYQQIISNNSNHLNYTWDSTSVPTGEYRIRIESVDNETLSSFSYSKNITIDNDPPYFTTIPSFVNISNYTTSVGVDFNAADVLSSISGYSINWNSRLTINNSGWLTNSTPLLAALYYVNVTINDTFNNLNSTIFIINITEPPAPYSGPSGSGHSSSGSSSSSPTSISLYKVDVEYETWGYGLFNKIYVKTLDISGKPVDVESLDLELLGPLFITSKSLVRKDVGEYEGTYMIPSRNFLSQAVYPIEDYPQNLTEITMNVTAKDGPKLLNQQVVIPIEERSIVDVIKNEGPKKLNSFYEFVKENILVVMLTFIGLVALIGLITFSVKK